MAKLIQSLEARGINPVTTSAIAGTAVTKRYTIAIPSDIAVGDKIELACIPHGCRVTDIVVDADDGLGLTTKVGIMSGHFGDEDTTRTCGDEFFASIDMAATGGVHRPEKISAYRTQKSDDARAVGIEVLAIATVGQGEIGITLTVVA